MAQPEPWLRGIEAGIDPVVGHCLRGAQHIREDLEAAISGLSREQLWAPIHGLTCAGFQAKHLAGSTRRLCTYLEGGALSAEQLAEIAGEGRGEESAAELLQIVDEALRRYEGLLRALSAEEFGAVREIGRAKLRTTAISLAIHIVEHGMRHVGLAIAAGKAARNG